MTARALFSLLALTFAANTFAAETGRTSTEDAGVIGGASTYLYSIFYGTCQKPKDLAAEQAALAPITKQKPGTDPTNSLFGALAGEQKLATDCDLKKVGNLLQGPKFAQVKADAVQKIRLVAKLDFAIKNALSKASMDNHSFALTYHGTDIEGDRKKIFDNYNKLRVLREAIVASIPFSDRGSVETMLRRMKRPQSEMTPDHLSRWTDQEISQRVDDAYKGLDSELKGDSTRLGHAYENDGQGLSTADKNSLAKDPALLGRLKAKSPSSAAALQDIACRADAAYGRGRDALDTTVDVTVGVVGLAAGGVGLLAKTAQAGVWAARTQGLVSARSARSLALVSTFGGGGASLSHLQKCLGQNLHGKLNADAPATFTCEGASGLENLEHENCLLAGAFATLSLGSSYPFLREAAAKWTALGRARATVAAGTEIIEAITPAAARLARAREIAPAGTQITPRMQEGVEAAHQMFGTKMFGELTPAEAALKARLLQRYGWDPVTAKELVRRGVAGRTQPLADSYSSHQVSDLYTRLQRLETANADSQVGRQVRETRLALLKACGEPPEPSKPQCHSLLKLVASERYESAGPIANVTPHGPDAPAPRSPVGAEEPPARGPPDIGVLEGKRGSRTTPVATLDERNAPAIFNEPLTTRTGEQLKGAKALTYVDDQGRPQVVFWSSSDAAGVPTQVHHRDAAASVFHSRASALAQRSEETLERAYRTTDKALQERLLEEATALEKSAAEMRALATSTGGAHSPRTSTGLNPAHFRDMHGFQLSGATDAKGIFKIKNLDIDSSITGLQANAIYSGNMEASDAWLKTLASQIRATHNAIPAELRDYASVRMKADLYDALSRRQRQLLMEDLKGIGLKLERGTQL